MKRKKYQNILDKKIGNIVNKKGKIIKPIGKTKKGGNKSEDKKPRTINLSKIFKLYNFFYF